MEEQGTVLTDLPAALLGTILSHLSDPRDIICASCTSQYVSSCLTTAPLCLKVRLQCPEPASVRQHTGSHGAEPSGFSLSSCTSQAVSSICRLMPSTEELDLATCLVRDDDVAALLESLSRLDTLVLDSCQKLSSSVADHLARWIAQSHQGCLSMQRCFRLGPAAAKNILAAGSGTDLGVGLGSLLLSHLDYLDLCGEDEEPLPGGKVPAVTMPPGGLSSSLRILGLHNCGGLGEKELLTVAAICPSLVLLLLGGSGNELDVGRVDRGGHPCASAVASMTAGAIVLTRVIQQLPELMVLEVTHFGAHLVASLRSMSRSGVQILDFSEKDSILVAAAQVVVIDRRDCRTMSQLLDASWHFQSGITERAQRISSGFGPPPSSGRSEGREVKGQVSRTEWGDCGSDDEGGSEGRGGGSNVVMAEDRERGRGGGREKGEKRWGDGVPLLQVGWQGVSTRPTAGRVDARWQRGSSRWGKAVAMAFSACANCNDGKKRSPLQLSALTGSVESVAGLLALGAGSEARDLGGGTALFRAAEAGEGRVVEVLLKGGANPLSGNRAGENALYIAALKGHLAAVEAMVRECWKRGLPWQEAGSYGDRWTPLMAAAVAGRQDILKLLLQAARADRGEGGKGGAALVVNARNLYGQTALHIAARKACVKVVCALLDAGADVNESDCYGVRAAEVAEREGNWEVHALLERQVAVNLAVKSNLSALAQPFVPMAWQVPGGSSRMVHLAGGTDMPDGCATTTGEVGESKMGSDLEGAQKLPLPRSGRGKVKKKKMSGSDLTPGLNRGQWQSQGRSGARGRSGGKEVKSGGNLGAAGSWHGQGVKGNQVGGGRGGGGGMRFEGRKQDLSGLATGRW